MRLTVPYVGKLAAIDVRLIRLAEFLGIPCETVELPPVDTMEAMRALRRHADSCVTINPEVLEGLLTSEAACREFARSLVSEFRHILFHAPRRKECDSHVVAALSDGAIGGISEETAPGLCKIAPRETEMCGAFAGLSIPSRHSAARTFCLRSADSAVRAAISIGAGVVLAAMQKGNAQIVYVGGAELGDVNEEVGDAPVSEYFLRFVPHAMALRYIFGEESWRPAEEHFASVIVDDPLLQPNYGFLNFSRLLARMKQDRFQTTIAFIPHNYRRNSRQIVDMFKGNPSNFALCFHGNDHMGAELASTDTALLNTMLQIAEKRMSRHREITGLKCDKVMVFPQGNFSVEAMAVLSAQNFEAAINTVSHPRHQEVRLAFADIAQPAVLRYAGFPLFLRKGSADTLEPEIAFNLFFGRPILIVEHHEAFQDLAGLTAAVARINAMAPAIRWSSAGDAIRHSILRRRGENGTHQVRAYSGTVRLANPSQGTETYLVGWKGFAPGPAAVLKNGMPCELQPGSCIQTRLQLPPGSECRLSLVYENHNRVLNGLGLRRSIRAVVRRRLSEIRDNYVSKNPSMAAAAKRLRKHLVH